MGMLIPKYFNVFAKHVTYFKLKAHSWSSTFVILGYQLMAEAPHWSFWGMRSASRHGVAANGWSSLWATLEITYRLKLVISDVELSAHRKSLILAIPSIKEWSKLHTWHAFLGWTRSLKLEISKFKLSANQANGYSSLLAILGHQLMTKA